MAKSPHVDLSRRERQIMYIIYERGKATANEVMERLPDPPSYSAVRAMLRLLEEKGHLEHEQDGPRYVYRPTAPREASSAARRSATPSRPSTTDRWSRRWRPCSTSPTSTSRTRR